jgi:hypothetical protein
MLSPCHAARTHRRNSRDSGCPAASILPPSQAAHPTPTSVCVLVEEGEGSVRCRLGGRIGARRYTRRLCMRWVL